MNSQSVEFFLICWGETIAFKKSVGSDRHVFRSQSGAFSGRPDWPKPPLRLEVASLCPSVDSSCPVLGCLDPAYGLIKGGFEQIIGWHANCFSVGRNPLGVRVFS